MISLSLPSHQPLEPGADLIAHLAASPRPAIIHYTTDGRTELSGRVAVNWATKMTHLVDSYGIQSPDTVLVDLPATWRSLVLALGTAWCNLEATDDGDAAAAILTDRPDAYPMTAAEVFVTQHRPVDPALVDVDDEVLSHADQALLPVPDIIGQAQTRAQTQAQAQSQSQDEKLAEGAIDGHSVTVLRAGTVIRGTDVRMDTKLWWKIIDAWRRGTPVVLVEASSDAQVARIIATERLD